MRITRKYLLAPEHETCASTYHCISRVVWRSFIFKKEEKEYFLRIMREYEAYCGVRVLSHVAMSNHVHILVKVPPRPKRVMDDVRFLEHLALIYSDGHVADVGRWLGECRSIKDKSVKYGDRAIVERS